LLFKFSLSILFPLVVYALYLKRACRNVHFNLAWLTFGIGAFYTYFVAESGWRFGHGNFTWSGQISLLILFISATVFFIAQNRPFKWSIRMVACTYIFALHLLCGLYWYYLHLTAATMGDIIGGKW